MALMFALLCLLCLTANMRIPPDWAADLPSYTTSEAGRSESPRVGQGGVLSRDHGSSAVLLASSSVTGAFQDLGPSCIYASRTQCTVGWEPYAGRATGAGISAPKSPPQTDAPCHFLFDLSLESRKPIDSKDCACGTHSSGY